MCIFVVVIVTHICTLNFIYIFISMKGRRFLSVIKSSLQEVDPTVKKHVNSGNGEEMFTCDVVVCVYCCI